MNRKEGGTVGVLLFHCLYVCVFFIVYSVFIKITVNSRQLSKFIDVLINFFANQIVWLFSVFVKSLQCILFGVLVLLYFLVPDFLRKKKNTKKTTTIHRHHTCSSLMSRNTESCRNCLLKSIF